MITVTQRNLKGEVKIVGIYTDDEFCREYGRFVETDFANSDIERTPGHVYSAYFDCNIYISVYKKVAYNENGKLLPIDHLVGLVRAYRRRVRNRRGSWKRKYDCGKKKSACGWFRRPHTTHERRWNNAWDDEEFAPKGRAKRNIRNLPSAWDDYWAHCDKCWKTQSKRRHQWKGC